MQARSNRHLRLDKNSKTKAETLINLISEPISTESRTQKLRREKSIFSYMDSNPLLKIFQIFIDWETMRISCQVQYRDNTDSEWKDLEEMDTVWSFCILFFSTHLDCEIKATALNSLYQLLQDKPIYANIDLKSTLYRLINLKSVKSKMTREYITYYPLFNLKKDFYDIDNIREVLITEDGDKHSLYYFESEDKRISRLVNCREIEIYFNFNRKKIQRLSFPHRREKVDYNEALIGNHIKIKNKLLFKTKNKVKTKELVNVYLRRESRMSLLIALKYSYNTKFVDKELIKLILKEQTLTKQIELLEININWAKITIDFLGLVNLKREIRRIDETCVIIYKQEKSTYLKAIGINKNFMDNGFKNLDLNVIALAFKLKLEI